VQLEKFVSVTPGHSAMTLTRMRDFFPQRFGKESTNALVAALGCMLRYGLKAAVEAR